MVHHRDECEPRLYLDNSRDYRLNIVEHLYRELWIEGGRNIVVIGGHITIDQLGSSSSYQDNTAVKVATAIPPARCTWKVS